MLVRVFFVVGLLIAARTNVYALHNVTSCGETCSGGEQCNLTGNLTCSTNPAVQLDTGADFNFLGHTITCSGCGSAQGIVVTAANSTVEDSVGGGGLRGYPTGINCSYQNNSLVKNVHIDTGSLALTSVGIGGCRKIQGVVIRNAKSYGIVNQLVGDSDYIKDSYILGAYGAGFSAGTDYGIWLDGDGSGLIDHNVIANTRTLSLLAFFTSSSLVVTNNMLFNQTYGSGLIGTGGSPPQMSGNVCGDPNALYNGACADCIAAGACVDLTTPLVVP